MLNEILFPRRFTKTTGFWARTLRRISKYGFVRRGLLAVVSLAGGFRNRGRYAQVQRYCMFVGYPRSGHSLVGSFVDAHPNAVISHELDALDFVERGYGRNRLFYLITRNSYEFGKVGRSWTGYSYDVKGQWQGGYNEVLTVLGDKKGGMSSRRLESDPELLESLHSMTGVPIQIIHVVRNPFDNISTISNRNKIPLEEAIEFYFSLCDTNKAVKAKSDDAHFLEFRLEELVEKPREIVQRICGFLELEADSGYLSACEALLFEKPRRTRDSVQWDRSLIELVLVRAKEYDFLEGYDFEN